MELPHNVAQRRLSIAALLVEVILAILIVIE
jgi:hypothetical protein